MGSSRRGGRDRPERRRAGLLREAPCTAPSRPALLLAAREEPERAVVREEREPVLLEDALLEEAPDEHQRDEDVERIDEDAAARCAAYP